MKNKLSKNKLNFHKCNRELINSKNKEITSLFIAKMMGIQCIIKMNNNYL